uniref:NADH dehydrogenase subunit 6 n=1 Tax=Megabalanus volcano TaxID=266495 RepID=Q65Z03_MEGVO|nr:NADH dehydrogenase subunit 6 [Megabalanus coccopoma]YP_087067.1 NADH dehydrogenase subunit 6 [Megabalanus volcano]UZN92560.1 NADH dehydrogenase subunit 6 [Megabalanus coccopoma]BAD44769.1 NADH dehydrogenase subunit 6 [Megabalanus volcano]
MMMNMILVLMFILNLIFLFMFHPLAMIFVLILQTMLISLLMYTITQFPWFSYTLILVFLGGMLILFTYMSNIASNEMFKPNMKMLFPLMTAPIISLLLSRPKQNMAVESKTLSSDHFSNLTIFKPFSFSVMPITILMACYIILTLLTVVKISKMSQGPLRII